MKMTQSHKALLFGAVSFFLAGIWCVGAEVVSIEELIANSKTHDARAVTIEGEAVGHLMKRGDFSWLNVGDKGTCIGVWTENELFKDIKYLGRYGQVGDLLCVTGTFNRECKIHGGDTDIHAQSVEIIASGYKRQHPEHPRKKKILSVLIGVLACLYIIKIFRKRR